MPDHRRGSLPHPRLSQSAAKLHLADPRSAARLSNPGQVSGPLGPQPGRPHSFGQRRQPQSDQAGRHAPRRCGLDTPLNSLFKCSGIAAEPAEQVNAEGRRYKEQDHAEADAEARLQGDAAAQKREDEALRYIAEGRTADERGGAGLGDAGHQIGDEIAAQGQEADQQGGGKGIGLKKIIGFGDNSNLI